MTKLFITIFKRFWAESVPTAKCIRGCSYCKMHKKLWEKLPRIQRKIGLKSWNLVLCSDLFRSVEHCSPTTFSEIKGIVVDCGSILRITHYDCFTFGYHSRDRNRTRHAKNAMQYLTLGKHRTTKLALPERLSMYSGLNTRISVSQCDLLTTNANICRQMEVYFVGLKCRYWFLIQFSFGLLHRDCDMFCNL